MNWNDLQELMQSKRGRTRRMIQRDWYTVVKLNVTNFSTSSNAIIQNNVEGFMRKKATHIQRKNCGSRNRRRTIA